MVALALIFGIGLFFYKSDFTSPDLLEPNNPEVDVIADSDSPFFENTYYKSADTDLFQIIQVESDWMENLKHFDFEYYTTIDDKANHKRIFYIYYTVNNDHYLKRYLYNSDDTFELKLPMGDTYYLITDSLPTFSASIISFNNLEKTSLVFFDQYTKGTRTPLTEGGSSNPKKIIISLQLTGPDATLIYDDIAGYTLRSTTLHFEESTNK